MTKGGTTTMIGGLVAAFLASLCCIGPMAFAALGAGLGVTGFLASTVAVFNGLLPYRPLFMGLTVCLLAMGFYLAYRKSRSAVCAQGEACASGAMSRAHRAVHWALAVFALALLLAPYWLEILTR